MIEVSVRSNLDAVLRGLDDAQRRQIPFATSKALNDTAYNVLRAEQDEMRRVFDRPSRWTLNGMRVDKASKRRLRASVEWRDFGGRNPTGRTLPPHIHGGARLPKGFENALRARGILPPGMFAVPTSAMRLDRHGNVTGAAIVKILSQLQALGETGYKANATKRSNQRSKGRARYFVMRKGGVPLGIAKRTGKRNARLVLAFVRQPVYAPRFDYYEVAGRTIAKRFDINFSRALAHALRTAR